MTTCPRGPLRGADPAQSRNVAVHQGLVRDLRPRDTTQRPGA
ncbi:hypothetical protein ACVWYS_000969 [Arthrobacter sp. TE12231]